MYKDGVKFLSSEILPINSQWVGKTSCSVWYPQPDSLTLIKYCQINE